jgi:hypothetical protein
VANGDGEATGSMREEPAVGRALAPHRGSGYRCADTCIYIDHDDNNVFDPPIVATAQHDKNISDA